MNPQYPLDFQQEQADLQRKQMLAQMLMQQGMNTPQGQMVSGHFVGPTTASAIAPLLSAFVGNKMQKDVGQGQQALASKYQGALAQALQMYAEKAKVDPLAAAQEAATSQFEPVKQLASQDYKRLQDLMTPKAVGDKLVVGDPGTRKFNAVYDGSPKFSEIDKQFTTADGRPIYGQKDLSSGKVYVPPGQGQGIKIETGDKVDAAFGKEFGNVAAKRLDTSFEVAQSKQNAVRSIDAATEDLKAGIHSGSLANIDVGMAKLGRALGMGDVDPRTVHSEAFENTMKRQVLAMAKSLGTGNGFTDTDREFVKSMTGANLTLEPESILRLMNLAKVDAYNNLLDHSNLVDSAKKNFPALGDKTEFYRLPLPQNVSTEAAPGEIFFDQKAGKYRLGTIGYGGEGKKQVPGTPAPSQPRVIYLDENGDEVSQ